MAVTAGLKKVFEELKKMGVNMERVTPKDIKKAATTAQTKVSWKNLDEFRRTDDRELFNLTSVCGGSSVVPPKKKTVQTNVDLSAMFATGNDEELEEDEDEDFEDEDFPVAVQAPKRRAVVAKPVDEEREARAEKARKEREDKTPMRVIPSEDPALLTKYDEEVSEENKQTAVPLSRIRNARVFVVQDHGMDQYVLGVTRSFDIAWDKLRYKEFNDCGECINKEEALKKINKDGFVVLKGLQSGLKVIIKAMEMEA